MRRSETRACESSGSTTRSCASANQRGALTERSDVKTERSDAWGGGGREPRRRRGGPRSRCATRTAARGRRVAAGRSSGRTWAERREGGGAGPRSGRSAAGGAGGGAAERARSGGARAEGERARRGEGETCGADACGNDGEAHRDQRERCAGHAAGGACETVCCALGRDVGQLMTEPPRCWGAAA